MVFENIFFERISSKVKSKERQVNFKRTMFGKNNPSHDEEEVCSMSIIKHIRIEHTTCTSTINISKKQP
jgi:hypothetical protein